MGSACGNRFGAPEPASTQGETVLDLWRVLFLAALALGAVVTALIMWSLIRYRRRSGGQAGGFSENVRLELFYTAVPLVIVGLLFGITIAAQRDVTRLRSQPDLRIEVTGFQWGWRFRYLTEGISVVGTSTEPPTMVLPLGQTARLTLGTPDVVHSFFVPEFLVKRDAIPGVDNRLDITTTRTGRFGGVCAEFCGLDHGRMTFVVEVVEPAQFQAFVAQQEEIEDEGPTPQQGPEGGQNDPGRQAAPPGLPSAPPALRVG